MDKHKTGKDTTIRKRLGIRLVGMLRFKKNGSWYWLVPRQVLILGLALQFSDWFFEQD